MLAASIHAVLLTLGHTRSELLNTPAYVESALGPLAVLAHDTDRGVARSAKAALEGCVQWTLAATDQRLDAREQLYTLLPHLRLLLLSPSPAAALREVVPTNSTSASGSGTPVPQAPLRLDSGLARDAKARDEANVEEDIRATDGRLAAGAAGALAWVICESQLRKCTCLSKSADRTCISSIQRPIQLRCLWSSSRTS